MPLTQSQKSNRRSLRRLALRRQRKTWRGKDLKKLSPIPWLSRSVVFTCSNGWTIEEITYKDWWLEGLLMGHCLGFKEGPHRYTAIQDYQFYSLRDGHGISHATIDGAYSDRGHTVTGRCNQPPPDKYLDLVREWEPQAQPANRYWGTLDNRYLGGQPDEYEDGILNDADYRDMSKCGSYYRTDGWQEKRGVEVL